MLFSGLSAFAVYRANRSANGVALDSGRGGRAFFLASASRCSLAEARATTDMPTIKEQNGIKPSSIGLMKKIGTIVQRAKTANTTNRVDPANWLFVDMKTSEWFQEKCDEHSTANFI